MKRLFFAISLILGLSILFSSCEKSGTENGKDDADFIVGCWTYEDWSDYSRVDEYYEYTKSGLLKDYYAKDYATFKDGVLSYPGEWELDDVYDYYIEDGLYWDEEYETCEFEMINKDKFSLSWTNSKGNRMTETFVRIKKFTK